VATARKRAGSGTRRQDVTPLPADDRWSPLLPPDDAQSSRDYTVRVKVWRWKGDGGWHFATLPAGQAAEIRRRFGVNARGWGSIRVRVTVGGTEWNTSLFPAREAKSYLFAIKAAVRKAEAIDEGDTITAKLHIL
jgi:hypothetical protein